MLSIIGYLLYNGGLLWSKKLLGFHQFLYFPFPYNFLKFQHLEQTISKKFKISKNHLVTAKPEKVALVSVELDGYSWWQTH
jgi:hypothetical protein